MQTAEPLQDEVISANIAFYREIAQKYDQYESCASEKYCRQMLDADLDEIQARPPEASIHCLDCGGRSGNLTLKMLQRGWKVTVVDVSPDMLELSKDKVRTNGFCAEFVNDSIENFLPGNHQLFSVITFSSVPHHLYSPIAVIREICSLASFAVFENFVSRRILSTTERLSARVIWPNTMRALALTII